MLLAARHGSLIQKPASQDMALPVVVVERRDYRTVARCWNTFAVRSGLEFPGNRLSPNELEADPVSHHVVVVAAILLIRARIDFK